MKSFKKFILPVLLIIVAFNSCTIEKRLYSKGYHLDFKKQKSHLSQEESVADDKENNVASATVFSDTLVFIQIQKSVAATQEQLAVIVGEQKDNFRLNKKEEKADTIFKSSYKQEVNAVSDKSILDDYNDMAIASFVASLLGFGILGIIFGAIALQQIKADPKMKGEGLATAGIVIGILQIVLMIVGLILLIMVFTGSGMII